MLLRRAPSVVHLLAVPCAALALLLPGSARAQNVPVTVPWGKPFTLNAALGFKLACPHTLDITILDPSICAPIDPPAETKKQAFGFDALAVGVTTVTLGFTGTAPCPGSASRAFDVTVVPDLSATIKAFKVQQAAAIKDIKAAAGAEELDFKAQLGALRTTVQGGSGGGMTPLPALLEQMSDLAVRSSVDGTNGWHAALGALAAQGSSLLGVSGLSSVPPDFQTGSGGSWDGAVAAQRGACAGFRSSMFKDWRKSTTKLLKVNSALKVNFDFGANFAPSTVEGPAFTPPSGPFTYPPRFSVGTSWAVDASWGLTVGGFADASQSQVHLTITGPKGFSAVFDNAVLANPGDTFGRFSCHVETSIVMATGAPADGTPLFSGLYRVEARYLDDTLPADVFYITVP